MPHRPARRNRPRPHGLRTGCPIPARGEPFHPRTGDQTTPKLHSPTYSVTLTVEDPALLDSILNLATRLPGVHVVSKGAPKWGELA